MTILYALDFDGVLVDSAAETGQSGLAAAKILWPDAGWIRELELDDSKKQDAIARFCRVRPCLETGWEAALIMKLIADPEAILGHPTTTTVITQANILQHFHSHLKPQLMKQEALSKGDCNNALKQARNDWIAQNNGQDWINAHGFFEGAVQAVHHMLETQGNDNVYIITTKAKEYAVRLLQQQQLCRGDDHDDDEATTSNRIRKSQVYGLGSGSKPDVLRELLERRQADMAVMVEDNLGTLNKIIASQQIGDKVLPALASWGYNTSQQQDAARKDRYVILDAEDSSSIAQVLDDESVKALFETFQEGAGNEATK